MAVLKFGLIIIASLLFLIGCTSFDEPNSDQQELSAATTAAPTVPIPTETPEPPTESPTVPATDTPTTVPTATATATHTPEPATSTPTNIPPTATATPQPASPTPTLVIEGVEAKVIYHDGTFEDGMGKYQAGVTPWMDVLVQLGDSWYGPEREPADEIVALPLPDGYAWEVSGGFAGLPNGEVWWVGPATEGTAKLIGVEGEVIVELPLQITF